jgi:hypothetical protein
MGRIFNVSSACENPQRKSVFPKSSASEKKGTMDMDAREKFFISLSLSLPGLIHVVSASGFAFPSSVFRAARRAFPPRKSIVEKLMLSTAMTASVNRPIFLFGIKDYPPR